MIKRNFSVLALAFTLGLVSCGSNSTDSTTTTDSNANMVPMMDSNANMAPAEGMGDSTMSGRKMGPASISTANDSANKRNANGGH